MFNYTTRRDMPTVFKYDGYARVVLETLEITDSYNLKSKEHKTKIKGAWNEYFKQ